MDKATYYVFAGINGSGKSTLYGIIKNKFDGCKYINPDEIAKQMSDNPEQVAYEAHIEAMGQIKDCVENRESFIQETTLAGTRIIDFIKDIKNIGYKVDLTYIGLDNKELAKERVKERVSKGGHNIPDTDIERRYRLSIEHMAEVIKLCDTAVIYDNSNKNYEAIFQVERGKITFLSDRMPNWLKDLNNLEINKVYSEHIQSKKVEVAISDVSVSKEKRSIKEIMAAAKEKAAAKQPEKTNTKEHNRDKER